MDGGEYATLEEAQAEIAEVRAELIEQGTDGGTLTIEDDGDVVQRFPLYISEREPSGNDPRCATCGDIITWGTHPICGRDEDGELVVQ